MILKRILLGLLIEKAHIEPTVNSPLHDLGKVLLPLTGRRKFLVTHKLTDPLVLVDHINPSHIVAYNRLLRLYILCPSSDFKVLTHIRSDQVFQTRRIDVVDKVAGRRSMP
jgi:hypothetical protein